MIEIEYITNKKNDRKKHRKIRLTRQLYSNSPTCKNLKSSFLKRVLKKMFKI